MPLTPLLLLGAAKIAVFPGGGASTWATWLAERSGGLAVVAFDTTKPWPAKTFEYTDDADLRKKVAAFTGYEVTARAMYPKAYPGAIATESGTRQVLADAIPAKGSVRRTGETYTIRPPREGYVVVGSLLDEKATDRLPARVHWSLARWPIMVYAEKKAATDVLAAIAEAVGGALRAPKGEPMVLDFDPRAFRERAARYATRVATNPLHAAFQQAAYSDWSDEDLTKAMAKRGGGLWRPFAAYPVVAAAGRRYFDDQIRPGTPYFSAETAEKIRNNVDFSRNPQITFGPDFLTFSVYIRGREFDVSL